MSGTPSDAQMFARAGGEWVAPNNSSVHGPYCVVKAVGGSVTLTSYVAKGQIGAPSSITLNSGETIEGHIVSFTNDAGSSGNVYAVNLIRR